MTESFGRRRPTDWKHVERYALSTLIEDPSSPIEIPAAGVEKSLGLPSYWKLWDQGNEGACVGYGSSAMMGVTNSRQRLRETGERVTYRFAPKWLYDQAQLVDEWDVTPPEEGTSVRAGCDVLRAQGHRLVRYGVMHPVDLKWGIAANRWARNVDEIRAAIYSGLAVAIGVDWYRSFQNAQIILVDNQRTISGIGGALLGGHCVCLYKMSDRRQAFMFVNSWGAAYPPTWIPYSVVQTLLNDAGEAAVITDR